MFCYGIRQHQVQPNEMSVMALWVSKKLTCTQHNVHITPFI